MKFDETAYNTIFDVTHYDFINLKGIDGKKDSQIILVIAITKERKLSVTAYRLTKNEFEITEVKVDA